MTGYLSPNITEVLHRVIDMMDGEIIIVRYTQDWDMDSYVKETADRILEKDASKLVQLFGFSLGCNLAFRVAQNVTELVSVSIYAFFPLISSKCLKRRVYIFTKLQVILGKLLATCFGTKVFCLRMFYAYGNERSFLEVLSGANAIIGAKVNQLSNNMPITLILARNDQYIDNKAVIKCCSYSDVKRVVYLNMRHCWNVGLFEKKQVNLTNDIIEKLVKTLWASSQE
ncbi:hypothetical protein IKG16_00575 [Candidatus Saccharibacteria bacterium]|nr:hypothetical protein [Candidatus Saccharibacteria bacterium]